MSFKMDCPHCRRTLNVTEKALGRTLPCPGCNQPVAVPSHEPKSVPLTCLAEPKARLLPVTQTTQATSPPPIQAATGGTIQQSQAKDLDNEFIFTIGPFVILAMSLLIFVLAVCYAWPANDGFGLDGKYQPPFLHGEAHGCPWHISRSNTWQGSWWEFSSERFWHSISGWLVAISLPTFVVSIPFCKWRAKKLIRDLTSCRTRYTLL